MLPFGGRHTGVGESYAVGETFGSLASVLSVWLCVSGFLAAAAYLSGVHLRHPHRLHRARVIGRLSSAATSSSCTTSSSSRWGSWRAVCTLLFYIYTVAFLAHGLYLADEAWPGVSFSWPTASGSLDEVKFVRGYLYSSRSAYTLPTRT